MKKEFKRIPIGINEGQKRQFESDLTALTSYLNDFFNEVAKYIEIKDKNAYKGKLLNTFLESFSQKYKSQFPEFMSLEKVLELCEVNTDKIKALATKINSFDIDLDYNTGESEKRDFTIYTESIEQTLLYEYATKVCEAIHKDKPQYLTFFYSDLQRGFAGLIQYDFDSQKLVPNVGYIQGNYKRL